MLSSHAITNEGRKEPTKVLFGHAILSPNYASIQARVVPRTGPRSREREVSLSCSPTKGRGPKYWPGLRA